MAQLLLFPDCPPATAGPPSLDGEQRDAVLDLLLRGLSPQIACQKLGLDVRAFWRAVEEEAEFRRRLSQVQAMLSENVAAMVYRAAIGGTTAAQSQWLKAFPPPTYRDLPPESRDPIDELAERPLEELRLMRQTLESAFPFEPDPPC